MFSVKLCFRRGRPERTIKRRLSARQRQSWRYASSWKKRCSRFRLRSHRHQKCISYRTHRTPSSFIWLAWSTWWISSQKNQRFLRHPSHSSVRNVRQTLRRFGSGKSRPAVAKRKALADNTLRSRDHPQVGIRVSFANTA